MNKFIITFLLLIAAFCITQVSTEAQRKQGKPKTTSSPAKTPVKTPAKTDAKPGGEFGNYQAITAAQLKDYLYFVASDEMEGRNTPSRGLDLTAKFIATNLSRKGLKPAGSDGTYFQKIGLQRRQLSPEQTIASINDQKFKIGEDFIAQPYAGSAKGQMVYVGHGLVVKSKNINAYSGIDVKDKIMVVADGYPKKFSLNDLRIGEPGVDFDRPESYAIAHGAKGIIILPSSSMISFWDQRYKSSLNPSRPVPENPRMNNMVPVIYASEKMAAAILEGEKVDFAAVKKQIADGEFGESFDLSPGKQADFTVGAKVETIPTQNVVAILEGSDPKLKNEYVAVGAHYDHLGNSPQSGCVPANGDTICNGADDDGSGTVAELSIAEALSQGPAPKRSVLFVWHAGEEKNLWGSEYITNNPPVPINEIITQLNIDMVGRSKKSGDTNPRNVNLTGPDEIYVIGSKMMSRELGELSESVNKSFLNLKFNYKYDEPNDPERFFYRSDHYNYARKGIPIIFYFDGVHEDYHRPTDSPDKIDYEKMEKVTRTVFATLWKLANLTERPKVDKTLPAQLSGN